MREAWEALNARVDELAAERQRYFDLFHGSTDAYLVTDQFGNVQEANHAAALVLGVPPRRLAARPLQSFVIPRERRVFRQQLAAFALDTAEADAWRSVMKVASGERPTSLSVRRLPSAAPAAPSLSWHLAPIS
ncbi:MAG: PAS domain-containing protein [Betaproteobacteria bacterium]|nr:PAS domain-containing protein [Betaproteobacteria bacterium]